MLPSEVILIISTYLERERDFSALIRTSQYLYNLLAHDLYRNNIRHKGSTGLVRAAKTGHVGAVKRFIRLGADIRADATFRYVFPSSPCTANALYVASGLGHTEIVTILLDAGANPNQGSSDDKDYQNPLHWAIKERKVTVAEVLLARGARFGPSADKATAHHALHSASNYGPLKMVQLLLGYGADAQLRCKSGQSPLFYAVSADTHRRSRGHKPTEAERADNVAIIKLLLEQEVDYSPEDEDWIRWAAHDHSDVRVRELFGFGERVVEPRNSNYVEQVTSDESSESSESSESREGSEGSENSESEWINR